MSGRALSKSNLPERGFQLGVLPERQINKRALAAGYAFIALVTILLVNLGMLFPERLSLMQFRVTELIPTPALRPQPEPVPIQPTPIMKVKLTPLPPIFAEPKLVAPQPVHRAPRPEPVEAPHVVINQTAASQIKMASVAVPEFLHTGDFSGSSAAPTVTAAVQNVQTGGFGDPNAFEGTGKRAAKLYAAQVGVFDIPVGAGEGNGSGGGKGVKGTVANADFGSGGATTGAGDHGSISTGGFGSEQVVRGTKLAQLDARPATTPVEIISKPQPAYTDEAHNLKLEGEVLLEVMFGANGTLHVNLVVRGLGHGLDDAAIAAANKMHFRPALRMGQPVDSTAVVHVVFQIAY